jgi:hypothetical protein
LRHLPEADADYAIAGTSAGHSVEARAGSRLFERHTPPPRRTLFINTELKARHAKNSPLLMLVDDGWSIHDADIT